MSGIHRADWTPLEGAVAVNDREPRLRDAAGNLLGQVSRIGGAEIITYSSTEMMNAVSPPGDWGPWQLDADTCVLYQGEGGDRYEVDLEWCRTSAEMLDWIAQIARKSWAGDATVAGLVRALEDVLDPQANLCSGGRDKRITEARARELARQAESSREQSLAVYGGETR